MKDANMNLFSPIIRSRGTIIQNGHLCILCHHRAHYMCDIWCTVRFRAYIDGCSALCVVYDVSLWGGHDDA